MNSDLLHGLYRISIGLQGSCICVTLLLQLSEITLKSLHCGKWTVIYSLNFRKSKTYKTRLTKDLN
jgi:hypothetical protein